MMPAAVTALLLVGTLTASPALADAATQAAACYTITDPDARAYCLAKVHRESSRCYSVQQADKRAQCLAEVRR